MRSLLIPAAVVWLAIPSSVAGDPAASVLRSERFNGTFEDLAPEIAPVDQGGITIRLSSPDHRLTVHDHRLTLRPDGGGDHHAELWTDFEGWADLVASFQVGLLPGSLEDKVKLPRQQLRLAGVVAIERAEHGYLITTRELPSHAEIAIQSRLGSQLLALCDGLSVLPLTDLGCEGLERSLSVLRFRLPPPGKTQLLEYEELNENERRQIDSYLARSSS